MMRYKLTSCFFLFCVLTGCSAIQKEINLDAYQVNLLPESLARSYLGGYSDSVRGSDDTRLYACRFKSTVLNDTDYDSIKFRMYDRSINPMFKFGGYKFVLRTNVGCVVASNDLPAMEKLVSAMASLGTETSSVWGNF